MIFRRYHRVWFSIFTVVLTFATVGCGGGEQDPFERYPVTGTVTLDGEPLSDATILFVPMTGVTGPKVMLPIVDGAFTAAASHGPVLGSHRVEIRLTPDEAFAHDDEEKWQELQRQRVRVARPASLPVIYNEQSILKADIEKPAGEQPQTLTFELKSR
jgi:hypothetical protein